MLPPSQTKKISFEVHFLFGKTPCCGKSLRAYLVQQTRESLPSQSQKCVLMAETELGYGNNVKDWVIRSVTSYVRYGEDMEGIQRLNGCW